MDPIDWTKDMSYPLKSGGSGSVSAEDIAAAVSDYMTENPISVPTKVSELENDSEYQTEAEVTELINAKAMTTSSDGSGGVTVKLS